MLPISSLGRIGRAPLIVLLAMVNGADAGHAGAFVASSSGSCIINDECACTSNSDAISSAALGSTSGEHGNHERCTNTFTQTIGGSGKNTQCLRGPLLPALGVALISSAVGVLWRWGGRQTTSLSSMRRWLLLLLVCGARATSVTLDFESDSTVGLSTGSWLPLLQTGRADFFC